ncbi:hypothetical protein BGW36DRAFT_306611, partial [Talaromyces proteolyticus]
RFIEGYTVIIILLIELIKKNKLFEWTIAHQQAFGKIKELIKYISILKLYNLDL